MHGLNDASTDPEQAARWWRMWVRANIGIAVPKGYVVLDVDGFEGLAALAVEGWVIPETVTAATGKGWHHWFTAEVEIRPGTDFMPSIDLRGPGGYVVAPPSLHATGRQYTWERSPLEYETAPAPGWLLEMIDRARTRRRSNHLAVAGGGTIFEHTRNDTLTRFAGAMRRWGASEKVILLALEAMNEERCSPPLEPEEIQTIAQSVARYSPEQVLQMAPYWEREPW